MTDPAQLRRLIDQAAGEGIAVTKSENNPEMGGIAAPIRDHTGAVVAALGLGVPAFRMDAALIARCSTQVARTAAEISRALNYRPVDGE